MYGRGEATHLLDALVGEGAVEHAVAPRRDVDLDPRALLLLVCVLLACPLLEAVRRLEQNLLFLEPKQHVAVLALLAQLVGPQERRKGIVALEELEHLVDPQVDTVVQVAKHKHVVELVGHVKVGPAACRIHTPLAASCTHNHTRMITDTHTHGHTHTHM